MQITVDLENLDNNDINEAIVEKINSITKEEFLKLLENKDFKSMMSEAIYKLIKVSMSEMKKDPISLYSYQPPFSTPTIMEELISEKKSQEKKCINEVIKEVIENKIGKENFIKIIVEEFPKLLVPAMTNYISTTISDISRDTKENVTKEIYKYMNNK